MGKRAANKIRNKQEIIDKAIQLFIEKGDEATNITDIIASTDLATGTFYNYFKNKAEIWDKIIDRLMQKHAHERERNQATTIYDFIYKTLYPIISAVDKYPFRQLITKNPSSFREAYFRNEEIENNLAIFERDLRQTELLENLPSHHYRMTTYAVLGACLEILIQSYLRKDGYTKEQITEYIALILENGLGCST